MGFKENALKHIHEIAEDDEHDESNASVNMNSVDLNVGDYS